MAYLTRIKYTAAQRGELGIADNMASHCKKCEFTVECAEISQRY